MLAKRMKKMMIVSIVVILILIYSGIYFTNSQNSLCVSQKIDSLEGGKWRSTINLDVSSFNKPSSFIVVNELLGGQYLNSNYQPLFENKSSLTYSWLFGKVFLPVQDTQLTYEFETYALEDSKTYVVVGIGGNEGGYTKIYPTEEVQCI